MRPFRDGHGWHAAGAGRNPAALATGILAWLSLDALVAIVPLDLPKNSPATINLSVLAFALTLSVTSALAFGLAPAWRLARTGVAAPLARASRRHGSGLSRFGGHLLIGAEVALAVVLLAGAGLMARSFARLTSVDVGFDPDKVTTADVAPVDPTPVANAAFYPALLQMLRAQPEVSAAGAVDYITLLGGSSMGGWRNETAGDAVDMITQREILPGYFEALGLRATRGRLPADNDMTGGETTAVVNERAVARTFGGRVPIGDVLVQDVGRRSQSPATRTRIVGVVPDIRHYGPQSAAAPSLYFLPSPETMGAFGLILRMRDGQTLPASRLRALANAAGSDILVGRVEPASVLTSSRVTTPRHRTLLLGLLGALGLALTLVGIFSVTAYAVAERTREIGVRLTFGATPARVVRQVVTDAVRPLLAGLIVGLLGAAFATRVIATFLFQTTPTDPTTFAVVALIMAATAGLAAWLPARRAAGVDPIAALRAE